MPSNKPLSPIANQRWAILAENIDPSQGDLLAVYCEAYADWTEASERVATGGRLVKDARGKVTPSPWLTIRDHAAIVMERLGATLNLAAATNVLADQTEIVETEDDDFLVKEITIDIAIAALRASGGVISEATAKMKISRRWFYKRIWPVQEIKDAVSDIRAELLDLSESGMIKLIKSGDREAMKFYLRCFGKERGWVENVRVDANVRGELVVKIASEDLDL